MPIERYRPSLTAEQIQTICFLCRSVSNKASNDVLSTLIPFEAKIQNGLKQPVSSVETLSEKLGWTSESAVSPEAKRYAAFLKWKENRAACTLPELELAADYRYTHGLMSDAEMNQHVQTFFGGSNV